MKRKDIERIRNQLAEVQQHADNELAAGRITPDEYWAFHERLRWALVQLDAPADPSQKARVIGIPKVSASTGILEEALCELAAQIVYEKRGAKPRTVGDQRRLQALMLQMRLGYRESKARDL